MENDGPYRALWRDLRAPEPNVLLRVAVSLASGLFLLAGACGGAWVFACLTSGGWVLDDHIIAAMFLAAILWFGTLTVAWRPIRSGRRYVLPSIATLALALLAIGGSAAVDVLFYFRSDEFLIGAILLLSGAAIILVWLPTVQVWLHGRPVVGADNLVRVHCPRCGYSLIGLRNLRCPECGEEFTIDELIRAQEYGGVPKISAAEAHDLACPSLQAPVDAGANAKGLASARAQARGVQSRLHTSA